MYSFKAPVDDIMFSLRHVAQVDGLPGWEISDAEDVLGHFAEFAENVLAPLNAIGDREGAQYSDGQVQMPTGFVDAYKQLSDDGWQGLTAPVEFGGQDVSPLIVAGVSEIFTGANHSLQMVCALAPGAIATLRLFGSSQQQTEWIPKLASGEFLSTMCLTEAAAGSDLSVISTRAVLTKTGWSLSGEKIYISGGGQDLTDGILHLVLARSGDADAGLSGLSLFLCPSQPGVRVTRIEDKMGLHASPTCQMLFDDAAAELIGEEGAGLKAMFKMMNEVRIDVALQGVAHASAAAYVAQRYAAERKQGRTIEGNAAKLCDHADVRRMLDEQRILAIGTRGICHIAIKEIQLAQKPALVEFLTSLCKVMGSEAGIRSADLGIQILGGCGYLTEYGMSQIWRDARITAIYEGANGIHKRGLVTRGLRKGGAMDDFAVLVQALGEGDQSVNDDVEHWLKVAKQLSESDDRTPQSHAFTELCANVLRKAVWVRIATMAHHHSDAEELLRLSATVLNEERIYKVSQHD